MKTVSHAVRAFLVLAVALTGCSTREPEVETYSLPERPVAAGAPAKLQAFLARQQAFNQVDNAMRAKTAAAALTTLESIDETRLSDKELAGYVVMTRRMAEFCADLEAPRDPAVSLRETFYNLDYAVIFRCVSSRTGESPKPGSIVRVAPGAAPADKEAEAYRLTGEAVKLQKQLLGCEELEKALSARYNLDVH